MPTVILLDVSLSMCRRVKKPSESNNSGNFEDSNPSESWTEVIQLANVGIGTLLDYLAQNAPLEYTALVVFSTLWEIKHQFTRNHESLKGGLYDLELYDKSNIVNAVRGVLDLKPNEWTRNGPINIVLVTDGHYYNKSPEEDGSKSTPDEWWDIDLSELDDQFNFPCKMQVVCLAPPRDPSLKTSKEFYKSLVCKVDSSLTECKVITSSNQQNSQQSAIWLPDSSDLTLSIESVENLFLRLARFHYKPYHTTVSCGHLASMVMLSPRPTECLLEPLENEFDDLKNEKSLKEKAKETYVSAIDRVRLFKLCDDISICGFMPLSEVASPAIVSRHLVLPIANSKLNETAKAEQILSQDPNAYSVTLQSCTINAIEPSTCDTSIGGKRIRLADGSGSGTKQPTAGSGGPHEHNLAHQSDQDITKQPSFCVLLHNSIKQENMVAICVVGKSEDSNDDWYGILHTHTDSKKRSSLMLSLLKPGSAPILWLPNFKLMGSSALNAADLNLALRDRISKNRAASKSYSSNNVIWLDPESVQADVQKIVRHAKRAPDKAPQFYKELNRVRRAAIAYGFYDVLSGLADILEREKRVMKMDQNKAISQETLVHIDHVISCLRANLTEDSYETIITPPLPHLESVAASSEATG